MEITQFTYFQQAGGIDLQPRARAEITYGLERLAMYLQGVDSVYDLDWAPRRDATATCATQDEVRVLDVQLRGGRRRDALRQLFDMYEAEARASSSGGLVVAGLRLLP